MVRPTYAEIDLGSVASNVRSIGDLISPSMLCAVVKADAYGHGDVPVAITALESGASWLAVAVVEEGIRLREAGIDAPILLLSEPALGGAVDVARWALTPTAYSLAFVDELASTGARLDVHLKIDTGMHRVGATPRLAHDLVSAVAAAPNLQVGALWTHFAVADEDTDFTRRQMDLFDETIANLSPPMVHMANTAGAIMVPESRRDMCRIGLGLYGLHPAPETDRTVNLSPAMRLVSHVAHVQRLEAGARPSYGRARRLHAEATVVTVPVGYADGFSRRLSGERRVLINGSRFPLAGMVTMDQIVVDVGDESVGVGDEVVLLGAQGEESIGADEWAHWLDTISYEVVCSIGPRVPRRHLR